MGHTAPAALFGCSRLPGILPFVGLTVRQRGKWVLPLAVVGGLVAGAFFYLPVICAFAGRCVNGFSSCFAGEFYLRVSWRLERVGESKPRFQLGRLAFCR